jgi:hypothetical protein
MWQGKGRWERNGRKVGMKGLTEKSILVCDDAGFKNKLMGVMVSFNL